MSSLSLALLGTPAIQYANRPIVFPTRKALALLVYLSVEGGTHSREKIAALLWPESDTNQARTTLRSTLALLRAALGESATQLIATRDSLAFDTASEYTLDVHLIRAAARAARDISEPNKTSLLLDQLQVAASAWRGDFMDGFLLGDAPEFDDWATLQREALHRAAARVCDSLTFLLIDRGELPQALEIAGLWVERDRLSEAAHRRLIQAHAVAGDRSAALKAYEICRTMLAHELGVEPEPETEALAERVRTSVESLWPEVGSMHGLATDLPPASIRPTAFVGRADQHLALVADYREATQSNTRVTVVLGEPGIGKTRLVNEFLSWAGTQDADIVQGRAYETGGRLAYHPLIDALRHRLERIADPQALLSRIWLAELARLLPELLSRIAHVQAPAQEPEAEARTRLFEAVAQLGHALANQTSLVLFIDDLQWADIASFDLLAYLIRRLAALGSRALIILTARTEDLEDIIYNDTGTPITIASWLAGLGRDIPLRELRLRSLTREDTGQLVRALITERQLTEGNTTSSGHWSVVESLKAWLYEETGGQPFFLVQTIGALLESRALRQAESGGWELSPPLRGALLPSGIRDLVQSRLNRLSTPAHLACTACAVLGDRCDFEQARYVSGLEIPEDVPALEELFRRGLLYERDGYYHFTHDTIREAAYAGMSETRRRVFHRRALAILEESGSSAAQLAHHAIAAGQSEAALLHSVAAGDEAMQLFAMRAAIGHYEKARTLLMAQGRKVVISASNQPKPIPSGMFLRLGRAYEFVSAWDQARSVYEDLLARARTHQDVSIECDALSRLATVAAQGFFDLGQALALLSEAQAAAKRSGDAARLAETEWNLAQVNFYCWNLEQSLEYGKHALDLALELENPELEARCRNIVAYNTMMIGKQDTAMVEAEAARVLFSALGNRAMEADCLSMTAIMQVHSGNIAAGIAAGRAGVLIGQEIENPWGVANCAHPLARGLLDQGEWGEALEIALTGVAAARTARHPPSLVFNLLALGAVYRAYAALDMACAVHGEALAIGEAMHHPLLCEWSAIELCADAAHAGEWTVAGGFAQQALALRREGRVYVGCSRWLETEALVRMGLYASAVEDLEQAEREVPIRLRLVLQLERGKAVVAAVTGAVSVAIQHLEKAYALATQLELRYDCWQIDQALTTLYVSIGSAAATASQARAAEAITAFALRVTDPELRAGLLASVSD